MALVLLLSAAGFGAWLAFGPSRTHQPATDATPTPSGYFIAFPESIAPLANDPNGGAAILATTNLPEGTRAIVQDSERGAGAGGGFKCCPDVDSGRLRLAVNDTSCYLPAGQVRSTGFDITVTITPTIDTGGFGDCPGGCTPSPQPRAVLDVLGTRFERLTGDQVTTVNRQRALVATEHYDWPEGVCDAEEEALQPDECAATGEPISEEEPSAAAASLVGVFLQARLCELWGAATPDFQHSNPWPDFRDRVNTWLTGLGPLVSATGEARLLDREVVSESPETFTGSHGLTLPVSFVARYLYKGEEVARAEFVNVGPRASNIVTQWRVSRLELS